MAAAVSVPPRPGAFVAHAPGTLVVIGDPAEWTDASALVVPTERRVTVVAEHATGLEALRSADDEAWFDGEDGPLAWIGRLAHTLSRTWGLPRTGRLRLEGDLRHGQGVRAAAAIAVVRALAGLHGRTLDPAQEIALARESCPFRALALAGSAHGTPIHVRTAHGDIHATPVSGHLHLVHGRFPRSDTPRRARAELRAMLAGELRLRDVVAVHRVAALHSAVEDHEAETRHLLDALRRRSVGEVGAALEAAARADAARSRDSLGGLRCPGAVQALRALAASGSPGARMLGPGGDLGVVAVFADADGAAGGARALDALGVHAETVRVDSEA
ncbi:MAG: hypothetical protein RLZZ299_2728 [Pseudomonadota bacterium]|jgi:hypothetical protein